MALLLYPVVVLLRPLVLIRFAHLPGKRIGHLAFQGAYYLAEQQLGMHPARSFDIFHVRPLPPCNQALVRLFERPMRIWQGSSHFYKLYKRLPGSQAHLAHPKAKDHGDLDLDDVLARSEAGVSLTEAEQAEGWDALASRDVPRGAPLICVHARSPAYLTEAHGGSSAGLESRHDYRNADIDSYLPALDAMAAKGVYSFRLGAVADKPLESESSKIIDYANEFRSEFLDIFLLANCRFMIACASGPDAVAILFRKPVVFVNYPVPGALHSWLPTVTIPKKYRLIEEDRIMTFREVLRDGCHFLLGDKDYAAYGIELIPNTPEEIHDAVMEMEARLDGTWTETPEDRERQDRFWSLFEGYPLHKTVRTRIGAAFLRQNEDLLV